MRQTPGLGMLWGGPCDSEGLSIATLCTAVVGPTCQVPTAANSSHGLAFNPFCLGKLLDPCEMGAMRIKGWEGGSPWFQNTPHRGYMMLHWVAPQQSLMSANPVLATVGLLGGGSAFFSAREPAAIEKQREKERRVRKQNP